MRANVMIAVAIATSLFAVDPASARSPGASIFGYLTIGPGNGNLLYFDWQINDAGPSATHPTAPGVAGPMPDANNLVSGWSQWQARIIMDPINPWITSGNLTWTATPAAGQQFQFALETLLGPRTTVGITTDEAMFDFDPNLKYTWPFISYQGTYTGPLDSATLTASTLLDTSQFVNAVPATARFTISLDQVNKQMDLIYTPVPEPGTFGLVAVGLLWVWRGRRRRGR